MTETAEITKITVHCKGVKEVEKFRKDIAMFMEFQGVRVLEENYKGQAVDGIDFDKTEVKK